VKALCAAEKGQESARLPFHAAADGHRSPIEMASQRVREAAGMMWPETESVLCHERGRGRSCHTLHSFGSFFPSAMPPAVPMSVLPTELITLTCRWLGTSDLIRRVWWCRFDLIDRMKDAFCALLYAVARTVWLSTALWVFCYQIKGLIYQSSRNAFHLKIKYTTFFGKRRKSLLARLIAHASYALEA
jgi:hypothetical protein